MSSPRPPSARQAPELKQRIAVPTSKNSGPECDIIALQCSFLINNPRFAAARFSAYECSLSHSKLADLLPLVFHVGTT